MELGFIENFVAKIVRQHGTRDAFAIAVKSGVSIIYESWHPSTVGEFEKRTMTIRVNRNALVKAKDSEKLREKIVAHELGHFFAVDLRLERREEENFAHLFAEALLNKDK